MAQVYLSENKWRMVRRVCRKKRFRYEDARNMTRHDRVHFDFLVEFGFVVPVGDEMYELTDKGKAAADLGAYEFEPVRPPKPASRRKVK
ncbi:MAG: hypothetical protein JWO38_799 [Gemmataceae bacterium]|nr:hypothetical protein [Gemmataceae bacterium]